MEQTEEIAGLSTTMLPACEILVYLDEEMRSVVVDLTILDCEEVLFTAQDISASALKLLLPNVRKVHVDKITSDGLQKLSSVHWALTHFRTRPTWEEFVSSMSGLKDTLIELEFFYHVCFNRTTIFNNISEVTFPKPKCVIATSQYLYINPLSHFGPALENSQQLNINKGTIFLSEHPFSLLVAKNQTKMPLLVGFNEYEGLDITNQILHEKEMVTLVNEHWEEIAHELLRYPRSRTDLTKQINKFYFLKNDTDLNSTDDTINKPTPQPSLTTTPKFYLPTTFLMIYNVNNASDLQVPAPVNTTQQHNTTTVNVLPDDNEEEPTINFKSQYKSFTNLITDRFYTSTMFESVRLHLNNSRIYVYENLYPSEHPVYVTEEHKEKPSIKKVLKDKLNKLTRKKANLTQQLVGFGDDLPLLFKSPEYEIKDNMKDYETSKQLLKLWVQLAKNDTTMTYFKHAWAPVNGTVEDYSLMRFGTTPELPGMRKVSESLKRRLKFWSSRLYFPLINQ
ncbi:unnamed protein product [Orchesella dallaii]|uniref:Carboxylesterase type B domain-containing protein n=1 Tax=Orchesella dallaii TaxID=48710 RepID=A0ABP1RK26_9HEXA